MLQPQVGSVPPFSALQQKPKKKKEMIIRSNAIAGSFI
jgi:hypothetical protein